MKIKQTKLIKQTYQFLANDATGGTKILDLLRNKTPAPAKGLGWRWGSPVNMLLKSMGNPFVDLTVSFFVDNYGNHISLS